MLLQGVQYITIFCKCLQRPCSKLAWHLCPVGNGNVLNNEGKLAVRLFGHGQVIRKRNICWFWLSLHSKEDTVWKYFEYRGIISNLQQLFNNYCKSWFFFPVQLIFLPLILGRLQPAELNLFLPVTAFIFYTENVAMRIAKNKLCFHLSR